MSPDLAAAVDEVLMPELSAHGFRVTESSVARVFDNATVVVEGEGLVLEIERERGVVHVGVAPTFAPGQPIDSGFLFDYLGEPGRLFTGGDLAAVLADVGRSLPGMLPRLQEIFSRERWEGTRAEIEALKRRRAGLG